MCFNGLASLLHTASYSLSSLLVAPPYGASCSSDLYASSTIERCSEERAIGQVCQSHVLSRNPGYWGGFLAGAGDIGIRRGLVLETFSLLSHHLCCCCLWLFSNLDALMDICQLLEVPLSLSPRDTANFLVLASSSDSIVFNASWTGERSSALRVLLNRASISVMMYVTNSLWHALVFRVIDAFQRIPKVLT